MATIPQPAEDLEGQVEEHVGTPGSYVLNAAYIVVFFVAYLWMFHELSLRWPVH